MPPTLLQCGLLVMAERQQKCSNKTCGRIEWSSVYRVSSFWSCKVLSCAIAEADHQTFSRVTISYHAVEQEFTACCLTIHGNLPSLCEVLDCIGLCLWLQPCAAEKECLT